MTSLFSIAEHLFPSRSHFDTAAPSDPAGSSTSSASIAPVPLDPPPEPRWQENTRNDDNNSAARRVYRTMDPFSQAGPGGPRRVNFEFAGGAEGPRRVTFSI